MIIWRKQQDRTDDVSSETRSDAKHSEQGTVVVGGSDAPSSVQSLPIDLPVGLPSWVKTIRPHQQQAVDEICELFDAGKKVVWLDAPTGCLTGDTLIGINRAGKGSKIRLDDLVTRFNGGEFFKGKNGSVAGTWRSDIPTRIQTRKNGVVRLTNLTSAFETGFKIVYELKTVKGRSIKATSNHPFWTKEGWSELGSLKPGEQIAVDIGRRNGEERQAKPVYRLINNLRYHPYAGRRTIINNHNDGWSVPYHRLVVEAFESGVEVEDFIRRCKNITTIAGLVFLDPAKWTVHHKNEDHTDNRLVNLQKMTPSEHYKLHAKQNTNNVLNQIGWDEVFTKRYVGVERTFDLTVEETSEFIANEFVVHNSGKTLIGELVRRRLDVPAVYVCSGKTLQDQFMHDFPYAKMLKGKSNYTPTDVDEGDEITCADCTKQGPDDDCHWCSVTWNCPYGKAKNEAMKSKLAVLNTSYLLAECNGPGRFRGRGLGVLDECDMLESELMGFVEFYIGGRVLQELKLEAPKKGSHYKTIMAWIENDLYPAVVRRKRELASVQSMWADVKHTRKVNAAERLVADVLSIMAVAKPKEGEDEGLVSENWVRDNDAGPMMLKPVSVGVYGVDKLWQHADRWLCMSATIVSPEMMAESLGVEDGDWGVVRVPMTFKVENRRIVNCPVANMTMKEKDTAWPEMVKGIKAVLARHVGERVLVHAVSYKLAEYLTSELRNGANDGRRIITYRSAQDREGAISLYRNNSGSVLVAPSLDRGVDFKDDDCRVVIVAKMPFPYLGDPQVSKRMNGRNGNMWYAVQTVRSLVQMTGRGVRSEDDWCVSYVLDGQFGSNVWKKNKGLFPSWWREAVEFERKRELVG